jgi:uncharacterized membrane protein
MPTSTDFETADRLSRRRARALPALGLFFLAGQPIYFANSGPDASQVKTFVWLLWALILLVVLAAAGGHFRSKAVRDLVEDEVTRANRLRAYAAGFWAAMVTTIGLYGFSLFDNLKGRESLHIILTFAVAVALIVFGLLERRAHKDG